MHVGGKTVHPHELSISKRLGRAGAPVDGRSQHPCILKDEGYIPNGFEAALGIAE